MATTIECKKCADVLNTCCGGGTTSEVFSGLLVTVNGAPKKIYAPFEVKYTAGSVILSDLKGSRITVALADTAYTDMPSLRNVIDSCKCPSASGIEQVTVDYVGGVLTVDIDGINDSANIPLPSNADDSITGDGSLATPFKFVNDQDTPGANKVYGTNGAGAKGWKDDPAGAGNSDNSVVGDGTVGAPFQLENDAASPGANKVYGTNGAGAKGWKNDPAGGGGTSLYEYQATGVGGAVDEGCFITATANGATYQRTGGAAQNTEGTLTLPADTILRGATIHFSAAQAPGNTFYLNVVWPQVGKAVNGSRATLKGLLATVATKPATLTDVDPALNYVHSGTPLQVGIAGISTGGGNTTYRVKITNYNQQTGANESMLVLLFA